VSKFKLSKLGPGLLFAGAAIGVSHLVQSTRAGADFGWGLVWALLLINLFKYPFSNTVLVMLRQLVKLF
jgi:Mn2+/Fe2+ NRAMP family transporter